MATIPEEIKLNIPWDLIDASAGLALDIGSSATKIVYLHKDDWVQPEHRVKDSKGCVRVLRFPKDKLEEAYAHLKQNMHDKRRFPEETIKLDITGVGSAQYNDNIMENLNVKNTILDEGSCFEQGFRYLLSTIPRRELLHELHKPTLEAAKKQYAQRKERVEKLKGKSELATGDLSQDIFSFFDETEALDDHVFTEDKSIFPCILFLVGSANACLVITEDGIVIGDVTYRGGRMFLGLGSLLTNTKTYDGLMALSEKGSAMKVSSTTKTVLENLDTEGGDDIYHTYKKITKDKEEETFFSFGQAVGKGRGDFTKEDIAACLLENMAADAACMGHNAAEKYQTKHVFFCGSFPGHPYARQILLKEWLRRHQSMARLNPQVHKCEPHFLKHGPYLGAIGALLNSKLQFRPDQKAA